ncbi:MAG TPA: polysaccharide deacetylase family protein [Fimbriimonadaceae bacterium]|nr:polysaccharide deacetylase family protein [Fimbriimonadaceae bacterium]
MRTRCPQPRLTLLLAALLALLAVGGCRPTRSPSTGVSTNGLVSTPPKPPVTPKIAIRSMSRRVPVIMYHDVLPKGIPDWQYFDTTPEEFEAQMAMIEAHGFQPITADQLYTHLTEGADIPLKSIVLTFDDNYRGFYENAYPILKKHNFPAIEFVHTDYVGKSTGEHPKMTWEQLAELNKSGLVTIGSHTESHPADITTLYYDAQKKEIFDSKSILEKHLGAKVDFFAYPDGKNDSVSQGLVKEAGYKMAFGTNTGLAEESKSLFTVRRYEHLKLEQALKEAENSMSNGPAALVEQPLTDSPVTLTVGVYEGLKIAFVKGGLPLTVLSETREGVPDLVSENQGAAGINGSFFAMAQIASTSNEMIGPCYVSTKKLFMPETSPDRAAKLRNRPVVMWDGKKVAIFNFQPETFNEEEPYRDFMPEFTDLFLAGGWLIHNGVALTEEQLNAFATHDFRDTRRRAFFGWTAKGEPVAGASLQTCSSQRLGEAAAAAGVLEAVLLDSGFSTSLVYNGRIVVTGHTAPNLPSRPVPHAIVLKGSLDLNGADAMLASAAEGAQAPADVEGERRALRRRAARRLLAARKKAADEAAAAVATDTTPPPDIPPPDTGGSTTGTSKP